MIRGKARKPPFLDAFKDGQLLAEIEGDSLRNAMLANKYLKGAQLAGQDLTGANLDDANLSQPSLHFGRYAASRNEYQLGERIGEEEKEECQNFRNH